MCTRESATVLQTGESTAGSRPSDVERDLRDLEIDGYKVVITKKVVLMPAELTHIRGVVPES